jgi:hypothetical protein
MQKSSDSRRPRNARKRISLVRFGGGQAREGVITFLSRKFTLKIKRLIISTVERSTLARFLVLVVGHAMWRPRKLLRA